MKTKDKYKNFLCLKCKNYCLSYTGFECSAQYFDDKEFEKFYNYKIRKCKFFIREN